MEKEKAQILEIVTTIRKNVFAFSFGLALLTFLLGVIVGQQLRTNSLRSDVAGVNDKKNSFISDFTNQDGGDTSSIYTSRDQQEYDTYIVQQGESLSSIAGKLYGDINAWNIIADANDIRTPDNVEVGTVLVIPRIEK